MSEALITAAATADGRKRILGSGNLSTTHVNMKRFHTHRAQSFHYSQVDESFIAFFAKTHPPHRSRRAPYNRHGSNLNRFDAIFTHLSIHHPDAQDSKDQVHRMFDVMDVKSWDMFYTTAPTTTAICIDIYNL